MLSANAPALKAAGLNSLIAVLRGMVTAAEFDRFVARLPPATRALVEDPRLAIAWGPLEDGIAVVDHAHAQLFGRDDARMFELGRLQLRADMTTIYRFLLRIATPTFVGSRVVQIYGTYVRNCGALRTTLSEPQRLQITMEQRPQSSRALCEYLRGSTFGVLQLTGVKQLAVAIGDHDATWTRCQFNASWARH
jgi:hypothetical protein